MCHYVVIFKYYLTLIFYIMKKIITLLVTAMFVLLSSCTNRDIIDYSIKEEPSLKHYSQSSLIIAEKLREGLQAELSLLINSSITTRSDNRGLYFVRF